MDQIWCHFIILLLQFGVSSASANHTHANCLYCADVASPSDCRQSIVCGAGEICYAKEFTDHRGLQAFRLGCEDELRCNFNLFLNMKQLIGKRDGLGTDPASGDLCYECCKGDDCNNQLCQGKGVAHVSPHAGSSSINEETYICSNFEPPLTFVSYKDSSYLVATWEVDWDEARAQCKNFSADLVSINSKDEQDFINNQLIPNSTDSITGFWTGGVYNLAFHEWEWVDRTSLIYTNWWTGQPTPFPIFLDMVLYIMLANPKYQYDSDHLGKWEDRRSNGPYSFICEKPIM